MDWYEGRVRSYPGERIVIDGQEFVVTEFRTGAYKRALPAYQEFDKARQLNDPVAILEAEQHIILAALWQNYPDMTIEMLDEHMTQSELLAALKAIAQVNGTSMGEAGAGLPPAPIQ